MSMPKAISDGGKNRGSVLINEELAQRIRNRILERGQPVETTAEVFGWSNSTLYGYLNAKRGMRPKRFDQLMLFLDLCE